jgi:16S rRNA (cytosine1402-N4)-methyltransferase
MSGEILHFLQPERGGLFVDCTVGAGGHARALLLGGAGRVLACDRDPEALATARLTLADFADRVELVHADFRSLDALLAARGVAVIDGAVADLGVSSMQLEGSGRGFSFQRVRRGAVLAPDCPGDRQRPP